MLGHLHCIWTLPPGDADFSARWQDIKGRFAAQILRGERLSPRRLHKGEPGIWQRRFWERVIHDEGEYERHTDYIYYNPVKYGHVTKVANWPYLSFHRHVECGTYTLEWAACENVRTLEME